MKKIYCLLLLIIISSCSATLQDIPKSKVDYVKSVIVCDSKTKDYQIQNTEEIAEFFEGKTGSVKVKYKYKAGKGSKYGVIREVKITRSRNGDKRFYLASFKRKTFPFSRCRKLKKPKYFK